MLLENFKPFHTNEDEKICRWISSDKASSFEIVESIAQKLNRKPHVIFQRAFQLNKIRYTPYSHLLLSHRKEGWRSDEIDLLIGNRCVHRKLLARTLNRSASAVSKQMYCLNLMSGGHQYDWTTNEKNYLRSVCKTLPISEICLQLNRHPIDVKHQCIELNALLTRAGEEFTRGGLSKKLGPTLKEVEPCLSAAS